MNIPNKLPIELIDWEKLVPLIGRANYALARYEGILAAMPNPVLLLSPLQLQEAVLSSRIEGTQASLEDVLLFEAEHDGEREPALRADIWEIINYNKAMQYAVSEMGSRPLSLNLIREIHFMLLNSVRGRDKARGEFRRIQNWIGPVGVAVDAATFVPPAPEHVPDLMDNWEKYIHLDELDRLVQLAIVHAQFEIIHPFLDGNGRVGRLIVPLFLFEKKLLSQPVFYISAYLEKNRDQYYARLNRITSAGDWNGWIAFFLEAIVAQAHDNVEKAHRILSLYEEMKGNVTHATHSQHAIRIIDALFAQPIFNTKDFNTSLEISPATSSTLLRKIKGAGIVVTLTQGRRGKPEILAFPRLLEIIT